MDPRLGSTSDPVGLCPWELFDIDAAVVDEAAWALAADGLVELVVPTIEVQ